MAGRTAFDLGAAEIVDAAVEILDEGGLDAVSMRTVAARLGVSPVPLYSRVGNKESLLDAMANRVLAGVAPRPKRGESWQAYAMRWGSALRDRLVATADVRLLVGNRRSPYVEASRPLIEVLRAAGFAPDATVQACRLVAWAASGSALLEPGHPKTKGHGGRSRRLGGDPAGLTKAEIDHLFRLHLRYVIEGIERDERAAR